MPENRTQRLRATLTIAFAVLLLAAPMAAASGSGDEDLEEAKEAWENHQTSSQAATSSKGCQSPVDGLTVCDDDGQPDPEEVHLEIENDNVGSVQATLIDRTWFGWTLRYVEVHVDPADYGPAGENETHLESTCWDGADWQPPGCNIISTTFWVGEDSDNPALGGSAECPWVSTSEVTVCGSVRAEGDSNLGDRSADVTAACGGFFTPCPGKVTVVADVADGEDEQFVGLNVANGNVGLCLNGDLADEGCYGVGP